MQRVRSALIHSHIEKRLQLGAVKVTRALSYLILESAHKKNSDNRVRHTLRHAKEHTLHRNVIYHCLFSASVRAIIYSTMTVSKGKGIVF